MRHDETEAKRDGTSIAQHEWKKAVGRKRAETRDGEREKKRREE
jgi:hypothetical protein